MAIYGSLEIITPSDHELIMTRTFDAPRELVFDALTRCDLLQRWYGPEGWKMTVCEIDLRVGGRWRFVTEKENGSRIGQVGRYKEISRPDRLVNTEKWEDWDVDQILVTTTFEENNGRTTIHVRLTFESKEIRDRVLESGLGEGASKGYEQLAQMLETIQRDG